MFNLNKHTNKKQLFFSASRYPYQHRLFNERKKYLFVLLFSPRAGFARANLGGASSPAAHLSSYLLKCKFGHIIKNACVMLGARGGGRHGSRGCYRGSPNKPDETNVPKIKLIAERHMWLVSVFFKIWRRSLPLFYKCSKNITFYIIYYNVILTLIRYRPISSVSCTNLTLLNVYWCLGTHFLITIIINTYWYYLPTKFSRTFLTKTIDKKL